MSAGERPDLRAVMMRDSRNVPALQNELQLHVSRGR